MFGVMQEIQKKSSTVKDFTDVIRQIPKAEIHIHFEAMAKPETMWRLIEKHRIEIDGVGSITDLREKLKINSLEEMMWVYINVLQRCIQSDSDLELIIEDAAEYFVRNNIIYAEIFFSPSTFLSNGLYFDKMIDRLEAGKSRIAKEGVEVNYIIDVSRTFGPKNAMNNLNLTLAHRKECIIGIGLGGSESQGPAKDYTPVFAKARKNNLRVVAHAGEIIGPESIWDTIRELKAARIGHGISAIQDDELMDYLREHKIPLEICPTSNIFTRKYVTSYEDHPIKQFFDRGIFVTLNTDDPSFFNIELIDEYLNLFDRGIFDQSEILQIMRNNIFATFLPPERKKEIWSDIRRQYLEWF
jgi:adenosine deaminase